MRLKVERELGDSLYIYHRRKNMEYYHHGDVLLIPVDRIDGEQVEEKRPYNVLALGEVTGHAHVIKKDYTRLFKNKSGVMFLDVTLPAFLEHLHINDFAVLPEHEHPHAPIEIEPGLYEVRIIRQYDPWKKELENVQD